MIPEAEKTMLRREYAIRHRAVKRLAAHVARRVIYSMDTPMIDRLAEAQTAFEKAREVLDQSLYEASDDLIARLKG